MTAPRLPRRPAGALLTLLGGASLAACDLRPLTSGDLFPAHDAGEADLADASAADTADAGEPDAGSDGPGLDHQTIDMSRDMASDASADGLADVGGDAQGPDGPACGTTCGDGTFCNTLTGRCEASTGTGMLSGVITDKCDGTAVAALMGIAGKHLCAFPGKGAYFFSALPLGVLEVAVAKDGYRLSTTIVEITSGGNVLNVALERTNDPSCIGPRPVDTGCVCTGTGCIP